MEKEVQDITKALKECEPSVLPKFVAYELAKLRPVTFDHIDVSRFLTDIRILQEEICTTKLQLANKCDENPNNSLESVVSANLNVEVDCFSK